MKKHPRPNLLQILPLFQFDLQDISLFASSLGLKEGLFYLLFC